MHKIVISNTTPIFYLNRLGYLELMERLYSEIVIPYAVLEELEMDKRDRLFFGYMVVVLQLKCLLY